MLPHRSFRSIFLSVYSVILVCCTLSPRESSIFEVAPQDCSESKNTPSLIALWDAFGPKSSTNALQCAFAYLKDTRDPVLQKSILGTRTALYLAERQTDLASKEEIAFTGVHLAERALNAGNTSGEVHYYLAANLGLAIRGRVVSTIEEIPRLEREMQSALSLSPSVDQGGPLRLLGMLYLKAPPWPVGIGDSDKALELLKQAVEKYPDHPLNHLFYAQAMWSVEGREAMEQVQMQWIRGMETLTRGEWGHSGTAWHYEFAEFQRQWSSQ